MRPATNQSVSHPASLRRPSTIYVPATSSETSLGSRARAFLVEHWPLAVITIAAFALRWHHLSRRLLIFDEFMLMNPYRLTQGLGEYLRGVWATTTYNPGWIILVWVANRLGGISACRVPSCVAGAIVPAVVYVAARWMNLSKRAGLVAGAIMAFGVYQLEYGQQVLPYAGMPLCGALCVAFMTLLARASWLRTPVRLKWIWSGFVLSCAAATFIHNSALIVFPPVFLYWAWSVARPSETVAVGQARSRGRQTLLLVTTGVVVAATALPWLYVMAGGSDRDYLHPFFAGTFRKAPIRWFVSDTLNWTDQLYAQQRAHFWGFRGIADPLYFSATRVFDLVSTYFRTEYLVGDQHPAGWGAYCLPWAYTAAILGASVIGVISALRTRCSPTAARWVICLGTTLVLGLGLSALRLFPIGGVRQWLCVSPLLALTVAVGVDCQNRWLSRIVVALVFTWLVGNFQLLPDYYRTTRDTLPVNAMLKLAATHHVKDLVCADGQPSLASMAQVGFADRSLRVTEPNQLWFEQLTANQLPFFMCAVSGPPLIWSQSNPDLRRDIDWGRLSNYVAVPLTRSTHWKHWFAWDVVLFKPQRPRVVGLEVLSGKKNTSGRPTFAIGITFSEPMHPSSLGSDSVHLTEETQQDGFGGAGNLDLQITRFPDAKTFVVEPKTRLELGTDYLLTLNQSICDASGAKLDIEGWEFHVIVRVDEAGTDQKPPRFRLLKHAPDTSADAREPFILDIKAEGQSRSANPVGSGR